MNNLKQTIIDALEDSTDLIEITRLGRNCDHALNIDFEAMADNVYKVVVVEWNKVFMEWLNE